MLLTNKCQKHWNQNTTPEGINTVLINCWQINVAKGRKVNLPEHIHCMLSKNTNITSPLMRGNCLKDHFNKTCKGKICQIYSCRAHFALKQTFFNFQPFNLFKCQYELQVQENIGLLFKFHTFYSCHQCHSNTIFCKLLKSRAVYGISKYSISRWVGNLENLMKNAKQQTNLNTTA